MALISGTHLGPYEVIGPLGAGGMGEVYRARDTRLDRTVAIKILPAEFTSDPLRKQRFEREAKTISSLNHPHICVLYDVGDQDGMDYLVMECVEGETLAKRLEKGPLPLDQVLKFGMQIAEALDKAHRSGVVHRDLKPGNIMLTPTGAKLLDFGLAKVAVPLAAAATLTAAAHNQSPVTQQGTIVGTFQYMSPEQVEGAEIDGRSDIFSLGAVLYEMLTGKRAFEGKSQLSIASAILEKEPPPLSTVMPLTPPALDRVVRTCLAKNPDERFQSAHDLKLQLEWIREAGSQAGAPATTRPSGRPALATLLLGAGCLLLAALAAFYFFHRTASRATLMQFSIAAPEKAFMGYSLAISPNGNWVVFEASSEGKDSLWIRPLDSLKAHALNGTEGGTLPFWSPDSKAIGFFAEGKLKKIEVSSGAIQVLCSAADARGGTWNPGGTILFSPDSVSPLFQVSADGGSPTQATKNDSSLGEISHRWPVFLPDGRHFLFFTRTTGKESEPVYIGSLDGPERKRLLESSSGVTYAPPGYLLFVRGRTLLAQPFDAGKMQLAGDPTPLAEGVEPVGNIGPSSYAPFSLSQNGILVYRTTSTQSTQLTWFDRHGKSLGTLGSPGQYDELALSPDGKRVAFESTDIWLMELSTHALTRFTFGAINDAGSIWSPDGSRIAYSSNRSGIYDLYWRPSSGAANEEPLLKSEFLKTPDDWSRDGKYLIYEEVNPKTDKDLWILPMTGDDRKPRPFLVTPFQECHAAISPDGRWVAYASNETGRFEIYVQSFPTPGGKWQISTEGGDQPQWRRDGKELFFLASNRKIMSVAVQGQGTFQPGIPQALFEAAVNMSGLSDSRSRYVFTADGQRALVIVNLGQEAGMSSPINVVLNWNAELKK
jgi:serine/threonine protein kinase